MRKNPNSDEGGRPPYAPKKGDRDQVKLLKAAGWSNARLARHLGIARNTLEKAFATELEIAADEKQAELLKYARTAAKKGNPTMIKWLDEKFGAARAAEQIAARGQPEPEPPKEPKLGKKEQQQQAAEEITGKYAPPPAPKLH